MLIDGFIHPVFGLLVPTVFKITVLADKVDVGIHHIPDFLDTDIIKSGIRQHLRSPSGFGSREKMDRITEMRSRQLCLLYIISIGLVDNDTIGHLHDTALDALQLIARTGQLNQQEEVYHGMHGSFTLAYSHSFDKDFIKSGSFTQDDGFTGLTGHTAQ